MRLTSVSILVLSLGCEPHTEGLTDLLDDGHSYVEFPGQRLLHGKVTRFGVDGGPRGSMALGLRDGRLVMAPFDGGGECDAGPAIDFVPSRIYSFDQTRHEPYVPFLELDGERNVLRFANHDCEPSTQSVGDASLPYVSRFESEPPSYLVLGPALSFFEGFRSLLSCELWNEAPACIEIASAARVEIDEEALWTIELDWNATSIDKPVTTLVSRVSHAPGAGWTEYTHEPGELVVSERRRDIAFTDPSGLHVITANGGGFPDHIEVDACAVHAPAGQLLSDVVSYRAPCEAGRLVIYDPKMRERFELGVDAPPPALVSRNQDGERVAFYQTELTELPEPDERSRVALEAWYSEVPYVAGTLWAELLGSNQPIRGPERVLLASLQRGFGGRTRFVADFDGSTGRLVEWDTDSGEVFEIASRVSDFGQDWVLADFDGSVGNLLQVRADLTTSILAGGVPEPGSQPQYLSGSCFLGSCFDSELAGSTVSRAVLSDFDGTTGTLLVFTRQSESASFGAPEVIARGVPPGGYRLLYGGDAVLYLTDYVSSTATGTLNARFLSTADTFSVADVASFRELSYPESAIVYAVPEGSRAGVWYARLR